MEYITAKNIDEVKKIIEQANEICLLGHYNPDGDAVGSTLGLSLLLEKLGKKNTVVLPSPPSVYFKFLPNFDKIVVDNQNSRLSKKLLQRADLIFCLDFNAPSRVKQMEQILLNSTATKIIIDHHLQPEDFVDFAMSDSDTGSAAEMVMQFIELLGYKDLIDKYIATAIYTGIMTDTLHFSIDKANEKTFLYVAELLSKKINKSEIYENVYNTYSQNRFDLVAHLLNNKTYQIPEFQTSYIIFSLEDKEKYHYQFGDHQGIVNMPLSVKDTEISMLFMENDNGIKISLRSKGNFDVNDFARKHLNGGGHARASGGYVDIKIDEIHDFIKEKLTQYQKENSK